jgi:hypothetical protein
MSKFESTLIDEEYNEIVGGKEIRPPLIPSNTEKIYTKAGIYNLKGFYEDLCLRLDKQKETILRIQENSVKNLNVTNVSYVGSVIK